MKPLPSSIFSTSPSLLHLSQWHYELLCIMQYNPVVQTGLSFKCSIYSVLFIRFKPFGFWCVTEDTRWSVPLILDSNQNSFHISGCCRKLSHRYCYSVPVSSCTLAGHRWGRFWGVPTQRPGCVTGWQLSPGFWDRLYQVMCGTTLVQENYLYSVNHVLNKC